MPKITCCPCFRTYTLLRLIDQLIYEMKIINDSRQTDTPPFRPFFVSCCFPRHTGNTLRFIHSSLAPLNTPNCGSIEQKTSLPSTYWHLIRWHERETSEPPRLWARKAILIRIIGALLIARSEIHLEATKVLTRHFFIHPVPISPSSSIWTPQRDSLIGEWSGKSVK